MRPCDPFDAQAQLHPDRILASGGGITMTYREGLEMSCAIAAGMVARGLRLDDGVAILGANDPLSLVTMFACWRAGGVWCPVNARNAAEANLDYLRTSGASWLFYHSRFTELAMRAAQEIPTLEYAICLDADGELEVLMRDGAGVEIPDWGGLRGGGDKLVSRYPTGGTTGRSKLVGVDVQSWTMLHLLAAAHWPRNDHPIYLMFAPITHGAGGMAVVLVSQGATVLMHDGFDAGAVLRAIETERVTHMFVPPTAFYTMLDHPDAGRYDYSTLQMLLVVSAPVTPSALARGVATIGPCVAQCWGQAESPMLMTWMAPEVIAAAAEGDHPERLSSCGRATLATRVAVMDQDGALLTTGETGELVARGFLVSQGYLGMPAETEALHAHGWHHTGDVGYIDDDGYVYIVDRIKDMIISGGFNVYSVEVEAALHSIDGIAQAIAIGVPDARWGEMVTAVVVAAPGANLEAERIMAICKERLGSVKAPKRVEFVEDLPKTPVGKIDKRAVRDTYWIGQSRQV
jgi:fatty-acyl-CoA synthase